MDMHDKSLKLTCPESKSREPLPEQPGIVNGTSDTGPSWLDKEVQAGAGIGCRGTEAMAISCAISAPSHHHVYVRP